jgi:hypothetical protein
MIATASPETGLLCASVTVAVAVDDDVPFAVTDDGLNDNPTCAAGPATCDKDAEPDTLGLTDVSVAVIVTDPAVVVDVTVATYVPGVEPALTLPTC